LQTASRIEGTVTDQTGAPIAGAKVTLSSKDSSVKQTTNNVGRFVFDSHPAESGIIVVQAAGFNVFQRKWTAADNDLPTLEVVLADGVPINDPFGGWVFWGRIPREAINRIEVVRGGASSLYGTDALGGVINLITRDARQSALSLEASYGNEKTPDVSLFAGGS